MNGDYVIWWAGLFVIESGLAMMVGFSLALLLQGALIYIPIVTIGVFLWAFVMKQALMGAILRET